MSQQTISQENLTKAQDIELKAIDKANRWFSILLAFMIPITTAGTNITALIILILFLASGQWNKKFNLLKNNKLAIFSLALYLALAIGLLYSKSDSFHHDIMRLMKYNKLLLVPVIIYLFQDIKYKKIGLYSFMYAMALTLIVGYSHKLFNLPLPSHHSIPGNIFIHHIITPCFMAFFTTFCLYKVICSKAIKLKATWLIFAFSSIYYIYFISGVRTGYLIQSILLLFFMFYIIKNKNINTKEQLLNISLIVSLSAIVSGVGLKYSNNSLQSRINNAIYDITEFEKHNANTSNGARLSWYINFSKLIAKKPIFGYGTGSLQSVYKENFAKKNLPLTGNPHNQYIEIAFKLGLFGLAIYLSMLFFAYKNLCDDHMINLIGKTAIILFIVGSCMNSWLLDLSPGFFLCYFAALANKPHPKIKNN